MNQNRLIRDRLNEGLYPGLMGADDFWQIWSGFKYMFKSIGIAVENLLGTAKYFFDIMVTSDPDELQEIKEKNQQRLKEIRREQSTAYEEFSRTLDDGAEADLHFIAFSINPTEYTAYTGASYLLGGEEEQDRSKDRDIEVAVDYLDRALLNEQIKAVSKIRTLVSETAEREFEIPKIETVQSIVVEKKKQIDQAINILQAPQKFVKAISESKDLKQVEEAFKIFDGTPYKIQKSVSRDKLKLDAQKMAKKAILEKQEEGILNLVGQKIENPSEKQIAEACEVILTKSAIEDLGNKLADPQKNPFKKSTDEMREYFIEEIIGPLDKDPKIVEILESSEEGKKYLQVLKDGKRALETAAN